MSEFDILLVEDSPTQAERLRHVMERHGYQPRVVQNGKAALQVLQGHHPRLVLSDVVMPEMDGFSLCRAIRATPQLRTLPVILVTSLADPNDIVQGLEAGADSMVRKPYADAYLLKRIEHVLQNQALRNDVQHDRRHGIALLQGGRQHLIHADPQKMLDLLISTYEQAVAVNEELRTREQQIRELNDRLARRAAELEASNREIASKNQQLQQASNVKSEFVANVSHELRTPLNGIIGFSEMLKNGMMGPLAEKQAKYVAVIHDSGKQLLGLINDILDLSRIEAGKLELELAPAEPAALLDECLTLLASRAGEHRIRLEVDVPAMEPAMVDPRKTRQIVFNLLSNAVKFTPDGGAVVLRARHVDHVQAEGMQQVGAAAPPHAADWLEIGVTDSGIGIAAEDLARLFQPFVQLESGKSRKYEGSGLGLALVKQLVDLHGGTLAVDSAPGQGSTFKVWLPYRMQPHAGQGGPRTQ
jgi:signal transduction histidine kinase